jgi:hypothetical protein
MRALVGVVLLMLAVPARAEEPAQPAEQPAMKWSEPERFKRSMRILGRLADAWIDEAESQEDKQLALRIMIAARLLENNIPTGAVASWTISLGAGAERSGGDDHRRSLGELGLEGHLTIDGNGCALFETAARIAVTSEGDAGATAGAAACLQGFHPTDDKDRSSDELASKIDLVTTSAYASAEWNVRPGADDIMLLDGSRFASARAGIYTEGARYHATQNWSLAAPVGVVSQNYVRQRVVDDVRSMTYLDVAVWLFEARYQQPGALTDTSFRLLSGDATNANGPYKVGTIGFEPASIIGLGAYGLYFDAIYGWHATSGQSDDEPNVSGATYRVAARVGVPWLHAGAAARKRMRPALGGAVVMEERRSADATAAIGPVRANVEVFAAHDQIYVDRDSKVDGDVDVWGVDGTLAVHVWRGWTVGAHVEVGRAFTFAAPMMEPAFGFRALGSVGWGQIDSETF